MAGQWIKIEASTLDKPETFRIARLLGVERDLVLGKLVRLWAWFDENSVDGCVDGVVDADVDALVDMPGFCSALKAVRWYDSDESSEKATLPNFYKHNGETAKKRAEKNARQARWRAKAPNVDAVVDGYVDERASTDASTDASTREEKRREEEEIHTQARPRTRKVPEDWQPNPIMQRQARVAPGVDLQTEMVKFRSHTFEKPKDDWDGEWVKWLCGATPPRSGAQQGVSRGTVNYAESQHPSIVAERMRARTSKVGEIL